ncbi:unnamed protein product, partial [Rotaria magnacalcarata]
MIAARDSHTKVMLNNGEVLLTAGYNSAGLLKSAEMVNSLTGIWTATGSFNVARYFHTATIQVSGKVLVVGGSGSAGILNSAELYDSSTRHWSTTDNMLV